MMLASGCAFLKRATLWHTFRVKVRASVFPLPSLVDEFFLKYRDDQQHCDWSLRNARLPFSFLHALSLRPTRYKRRFTEGTPPRRVLLCFCTLYRYDRQATSDGSPRNTPSQAMYAPRLQ